MSISLTSLRASSAELTYLVDLSSELGYLAGTAFKELNNRCEQVCRQLEALLQTMERILAEEKAKKRERRRKKPEKQQSER